MGLALDESKENEVADQINGINLLIADEVKGYTSDNTIDYVNTPEGEGFVIQNAGHNCC